MAVYDLRIVDQPASATSLHPEVSKLPSSRPVDPILLIGSLLVLAAMLTWVIPAGRFTRNRDTRTGQTLVVPGSYQRVPPNPVGPWGALLSIPQGLIEASSVVFYVFLAGGALTVVEKTGAIGNTLDHLVARFGNRPHLMILLTSVLFLIGGASYGMYEEILAFLPLLCSLMQRLKLDSVMALGVSLGTASVAASFSPIDTFHLGISQPMAELPLFSGFGFRAPVFVLAMGIWAAYLLWYGARVRAQVAETESISTVPFVQPSPWRRRDASVLAVLNLGMASIVAGAFILQWDLVHFSAVFVAVGFCAGMAGGLGWRGTSEAFAEGFRRMAFAAILVGFARAISVVLANGVVLDTIANALFSPLQHLPLGMAPTVMLASQSALSFLMPSDSGKAMISLPILVPLSDLLGLSRQMVVSAYHNSGIVSGLVTPTAGTMLAMLALARVPYGRWLRFIAVPVALLLVLAAIAMSIGVRLGVQ